METIINKLSDIEVAANKIIEEANSKKAALSAEMEKKTADFDAKVEADTQTELEKIRKELGDQMESELKKLQDDTEKLLADIDKHFNKNSDAIAQSIADNITRM